MFVQCAMHVHTRPAVWRVCRAGNASCDGHAATRPPQEPLYWCKKGDVLLLQLNTLLLIPLLLIHRSLSKKPQLVTDVPSLDKTDISSGLVWKSLHLPRHMHRFGNPKRTKGRG